MSSFTNAAEFALTPLTMALFGIGALLVFVALLRSTRSNGFRAGDYHAKPLLTRWELAAFGEMRQELPPSLHICPQVRLADVVGIREQDPKRRWAALSRVAAKSVDFAVIDTAGRTLLVVELDDRTHDRADRRERDRRVDALLRHCGVPVRRVRPGQTVGAAAVLALPSPTPLLPSHVSLWTGRLDRHSTVRHQ